MSENGKRIIEMDRSIIVAADVPTRHHLLDLCKGTMGVKGIGAFKFGLSLGLRGLDRMVKSFREIMEEEFPVCLSYVPGHVPIIYDHQKGGTDIPDMGTIFAKQLKAAGVDAVILFPLTGPDTQIKWTKSAQDVGLQVIIGGMMTHPRFLACEGGYIADDAPLRIYELAATELGIRDFVVPGNKIEWVQKIRDHLDSLLGDEVYVLYAPGFIKQGGVISECGKAAGKYFHAIVGGGLYGDLLNPNSPKVVRRNALEYTSQIELDKAA